MATPDDNFSIQTGIQEGCPNAQAGVIFFFFLLGVHYGSSFVLLTWNLPITLKHNPSLRQLILSSLQ